MIARDQGRAEEIRYTAKGSFVQALTMLVDEHAKWCNRCKGDVHQFKECPHFREDYHVIHRIGNPLQYPPLDAKGREGEKK